MLAMSRALVEMVSSGDFDPDRYRLLFFQACTTIAYLDEIRDQMGGPENIDVIGTRDQSLFSVRMGSIGTPEIQRLLEESGTESSRIMKYLFEEKEGEKDTDTPW